MKYKEFTKMQSEAFGKLPIFWAFSNKQLEEALAKRGYTVEDAGRVLYRFGNGGFYLKTDAPIIKAFFEEDWGGKLRQMIAEDLDFAREAFSYEMRNHEYPINWQGDYDVVSCFGGVDYAEEKDGADYLVELGFGEDVVRVYEQERRKIISEPDW